MEDLLDRWDEWVFQQMVLLCSALYLMGGSTVHGESECMQHAKVNERVRASVIAGCRFQSFLFLSLPPLIFSLYISSIFLSPTPFLFNFLI